MSASNTISHSISGANTDHRACPFGTSAKSWRNLSVAEISILEAGGNRADSWTDLKVKEGFNPHLIQDCRFYGLNRIGSMQKAFLCRKHLRLPIGLYSSTIISCDIADDCAIHNLSYGSHTQIWNRCMIFNVGEIVTTAHSRQKWVAVANENCGRTVRPFDGMLPADAWLWSKHRDDNSLMSSFLKMSDRMQHSSSKRYGVIRAASIIKNSRTLENIYIGESAEINGVNTLKNLTVNSSFAQNTRIGEGCALSHGIIGYGCRIYNGVNASKFVMNDNSILKDGAKFVHSILGPNSIISCGEVLNSLLFGAHRQHHKSSFLCSSILEGMSNIAAAVTVGSNHNSRAPDGELFAARGFWPALNVSLKHNSHFAAFCLIAKGAYPAELNISLPFCLVSNAEHTDELRIMPGYWFRHNMYALNRNSIKTSQRDARSIGSQPLEYDWLAPDTVDQMMEGRRLLEQWATNSDSKLPCDSSEVELIVDKNTVEAGTRSVRVLHAGRGWHDYGRMIRFYAVRTLLSAGGMKALRQELEDREVCSVPILDPWINVGGQLMRKSALENLKRCIKSEEISSWDAVHAVYAEIAGTYADERYKHAAKVLRQCIAQESSEQIISEALETAQFIFDGITASRKKDYDDQFRNMSYDTEQERDAVLGNFEDDEWIQYAVEALKQFQTLAGMRID